jgi:hypothetical protein
VTEIESPEFTEAEFYDHMACEEVVSPHDRPAFKKNGPDSLETEEEDTELIISQRMFDTDISADQDLADSEWPLHVEAAEDLRDILDQFRLRTTEIGETIGSFQTFLVGAPTDLFLKPILKKNRCASAASRDGDQIQEILSDISQCLSAIGCNKSVIARMNPAMKRMLSPFRLILPFDVLLSRQTIAHRASEQPSKSSG